MRLAIALRGALVALALLAAGVPAIAQPAPVAAPPSQGLYVWPDYDVKRDPEADLKTGLVAAGVLNRRVLVEVGGEWCIWCKILDHYIATTPGMTEAFTASFVIVKVNYSRDHENKVFLGRYPKVAGYPHFFVLEPDGKLLKSQDTGLLEKGESYDRAKMLAFAKSWDRD